MGVDVEYAHRVRSVSRLADRVLAEREQEDVRACVGEEQQRRFLDYWTLKEAFLKAVGRGITIPLRSVGFGIDADGRGVGRASTQPRADRNALFDQHLSLAVHDL